MNADEHFALQNAQEERIQCSAIHYNDGKEYPRQPKNIEVGMVVCGLRHCNCYVISYNLRSSLGWVPATPHTEGFLTNKNRFVDRTEGYQIAKKANQILDGEGNGEFLYSEDIY